jgi:hypothetical protein
MIRFNRPACERYRKELSVGHVYYIYDFKVEDAGSLYLTVTNPKMIVFKFMTIVKEVTEPCANIKMHKFEFVSNDQLRSRIGEKKQLFGIYPFFYNFHY